MVNIKIENPHIKTKNYDLIIKSKCDNYIDYFKSMQEYLNNDVPDKIIANLMAETITDWINDTTKAAFIDGYNMAMDMICKQAEVCLYR